MQNRDDITRARQELNRLDTMLTLPETDVIGLQALWAMSTELTLAIANKIEEVR